MTQLHFKLDQWKEAFKTYWENESIYGNSIALVLSSHPYSAGYWIEKKPDRMQLWKEDKVYQGKEVTALQERVRAGIASGAKHLIT